MSFNVQRAVPHFSLAFVLLLLLTSFCIPRSHAFELTLDWKHVFHGENIGGGGMTTFDLDGDGQTEVILTANPFANATFGRVPGATYWYVLRHDGTDYEMIWSSPFYGDTATKTRNKIITLTVGDTDGNGTGEIYLLTEDGVVHVHDGVGFAEVRSFAVDPATTDLLVGDATGDGVADLVTIHADGFEALSPIDATVLWQLSISPLHALALGNADGDAQNEMIVSQGDSGTVYDTLTQTSQWEIASGLGENVAMGDIDGDGMDEILAGDIYQPISAFDADTQTVKWSSMSYYPRQIRVLDIDATAPVEILIGESLQRRVYCLSGTDASRLWVAQESPFQVGSGLGVEFLETGDFDGDGSWEYLSNTFEGVEMVALIADANDGTTLWRSQRVAGPIFADMGNVDGDDSTEIVAMPRLYLNNAPNYDTQVFVFDLDDLPLKNWSKFYEINWA